jgi:hypothetical protein
MESMSKPTCQHCANFNDDPAFIEAEIPGLTSFGSAYSSARGYAGICHAFDRFMDPVPADNCQSFAPISPKHQERTTRRETTVCVSPGE